jgi:hypothetical protein
MKHFILALFGLVLLSTGIAIGNNYNITQGAGTIFGSLLVGGINYAQGIICDPNIPSTQCAAVSAGGALRTDGSAVTQPVSGGVNATQTGTWTVQPGNTPNTVPWLIQLRDAAGNARGANVNASNQLSVSCDNGCSATTSIVGWAGGTLGAMANYGTSPGAVLVPGVNASVTASALPAGAATSALQTTGNTSLASIVTNTTSIATAANQTTGNSSLSTIATNTTGAATAANQSTGNSSLSTIATNTTGAATAANQTTGNASLATIATNTGLSVPTTQSGAVTALISCDSHVTKSIGSSTDTLAVQGVTAKTIYICGWRSRSAGTTAWFLENTASANANCASTNTRLTGTASEVANSGEVMNPAFWSGLRNTAGNGLCINTVGTGVVDIDIWYTQF